MPDTTLPSSVTQYFWGDNLAELNWKDHRQYMLQTLLEKADREALHWLFDCVSPQEVLTELPHLKLSKKSRNFWEVYLLETNEEPQRFINQA